MRRCLGGSRHGAGAKTARCGSAAARSVRPERASSRNSASYRRTIRSTWNLRLGALPAAHGINRQPRRRAAAMSAASRQTYPGDAIFHHLAAPNRRAARARASRTPSPRSSRARRARPTRSGRAARGRSRAARSSRRNRPRRRTRSAGRPRAARSPAPSSRGRLAGSRRQSSAATRWPGRPRSATCVPLIGAMRPRNARYSCLRGSKR